ncbi:MAG: hypothetical protein JW990_05345 [Thermoleophilia bacterium]|nr:hypothetical protein [Thermoleophilia bacterium]
MPRGASGRVVIEVDPLLKENLYAALDEHGSTLRAWFIQEAEQFLATQDQMRLFVGLEAAAEPAGDDSETA